MYEMNINSRIATVTLNPAIDQSVAINNFVAGEVNRVDWEQSHAGGKGVNVASFLADLGLSSAVTGFIGCDNAVIFERLFTQKNIADHFIRIEGKTRVNVKIIDAEQHAITDINFPGQTPSPQNVMDLKANIMALSADYDWFVLSGSLQNGVANTYYSDLLKCLKSLGKKVVLDTSGEALRLAIVEQPYAIKPNIEELETLLNLKLNNAEDVAKAAKKLVQQGISNVVVSMGKQGAIFADEYACVLAVPPSIVVKSTVGAGDAMVAGFIAAKIKGYSLEHCARLSTATAMGALTQLGPELVDSQVLAAYQQEIVITRMMD
jgi:1-phosphofructokinase